MVYGFVPSKLDGTEKKFSEVKGLDLPESYSYVDFLPRVLNQGQRPICVPCSISAHLNWNKNVDTDGNNKRDNGIKLLEIYNPWRCYIPLIILYDIENTANESTKKL